MQTEAPAAHEQVPAGTEPPAFPGRGPLSRLRDWLPVAAVIGVLSGATLSASRPLSDPDTWWHLRLGSEFWGHWSLSDPGRLGPFATRPWFATQWIPEVVASKFEEFFGLPGVAWLFGAVLVVFVAAIYAVCRREADRPAAALTTALCFVGASASLSARPQLVSFVLLLVTTAAWVQTIRDLRARWWLVPLSWVWACSHGMWFTGVLVGLAVVVGLTLDGRLDRQRGLRLTAVPLLSVLAAAVTPVGPKLLLAPLTTSKTASFISEWAPPSFREVAPAITMLMICLVVFTWSRRGRVPWAHIAILFIATGWTLLSARTVALGAVMVAPLLAAALPQSLPQVSFRIPTWERTAIAAASATCLTILAFVVPTTAATAAKVPNQLNDDLARLQPGTVILNEYALGGWLTWRHPDLAPVVDGMTDAYTRDHVADYLSASSAEAGWRSFVNRTGASYALLTTGSPLATALIERLHWSRLGADTGYVLLHAPAA